MWVPAMLSKWKSIEEREVTERIPEALELSNEILDQKRKSRILFRADEINWKVSDTGAKRANLSPALHHVRDTRQVFAYYSFASANESPGGAGVIVPLPRAGESKMKD